MRKEPDEGVQLEETEEEENDDFENLYKGQISKSGIAILPSKRTRKIPEIKKPNIVELAKEEEVKSVEETNEEEPLTLKEEAAE